MFGVTRRQRMSVAAVLVAGVIMAGMALVGWERGALAGLAILGAAGLVLLLDARRRFGELYSQLRRNHGKLRRNSDQLHHNYEQLQRNNDQLRLNYDQLRHHHDELRRNNDQLRRNYDELQTMSRESAKGSEIAEHLDVHQRRLLAAFEGARLDGVDGVAATQKVLDEVAKDVRSVGESVRDGEERVNREVGRQTRTQTRAQTREIEALLQLFATQDAPVPMPSSGEFALRPTGLLNLVTLLERTRPDLVLELGSGSSTVWIATVLRSLGAGRVVAVDHLDVYADQTREALKMHGLDDVAEVRCAPLQAIDFLGESSHWYDRTLFEDLQGVDLLLVDGPPESTGPHARRPAFPALEHRLADSSWIVVDDAHRAAEAEMAQDWVDQAPGRLSYAFSPLPGQILLTYHRS